jgi:hypothetical protein
MFCPSCGAEYTIELKYCNRCGANLSASLLPQAPPVVVNVTKPTIIIGALTLMITLGGFGTLLGMVRHIAPLVQGNDPIVAIIFMGMLTIMLLDIFLVRLLSKLINASLRPAPSLKSERPAARNACAISKPNDDGATSGHAQRDGKHNPIL